MTAEQTEKAGILYFIIKKGKRFIPLPAIFTAMK